MKAAVLLLACATCTLAQSCGKRGQGNKGHGRIVGGEDALPQEFPWQVGIAEGIVSHNHTPYCGASVVDKDWVITAAHCFREPPFNVTLIFGRTDLEADESTADFQVVSDKDVIVHAKYDVIPHDFDVALVRLQRSLDFDSNPGIAPICLPRLKENFAGSMCTASGWGSVSDGGPQPTRLQKVDVPVMERKRCKKYYGGDKYYTGRMLCAGYDEGGKDVCQNDSGGPLVCPREDDTWVLAGITSWGHGCGKSRKPAVYTRVEAVLKWIHSIMKRNDFTLCYAGVRSGNGRIVGGTEAKLHEFPWQVLLIGRTYHGGSTELCGASLLNEKWVVTAAHCFWTERYYEKYELRFGKHDLRRFEPSEESRFVRKVDIICHPYYNPANLDNDVALMLLSDPLDFHKNPYVRPINLPDAGEQFVGAECIATGWGATRFGGPLSEVLLKVHLPVWSNNDCRKVYSDLEVTDNMFCAGYSRGGKDTCHGAMGTGRNHFLGRRMRCSESSCSVHTCHNCHGLDSGYNETLLVQVRGGGPTTLWPTTEDSYKRDCFGITYIINNCYDSIKSC
ncbi:transmembrane protease serine 9-like [Ornithodoros turicata]|uniref:transmembrane protease serine 9-like n=1 Tax=Ornithodoros turicata TaxID=34597 RepID=UPI00313A312A